MTEEERKAIREEEIYRDEVRKILTAKQDQKNKLWLFFNSRLGIWFLSIVVIGSFVFFCNGYIQNQKEEAEKEQKIQKLDLEIESRISQFWVHIESMTQHQNNKTFVLKQGISIDTLRVLWTAFKNPPCSSCDNPIILATYNEFERRSTVSLIIELSSLLDAEYKHKNAGKFNIEGERENLRQTATFIAGDGIYSKTNQLTIIQLWETFRTYIINPRWTELFPFTNCGPYPFC
jgi:hypothetical protein